MMKPTHKISLQILTALAAAGSAVAQQAFDDLGESTVIANRSEALLQDTPRSVAVISADRLLQLRTVPEALSDVPGILVQKTTHGHGSPFIRGFTGRQNLLMVDGIRINNSTYRSGPIQYWNTLDSKSLERLELMKGPGSVLYGSDALGGSLNAVSKGTGFRDQKGQFYGGAVTYKYDSNSESHQGRIETAFGQGGKWGVLLGFGQKDFGDIRDSNLGVMQGTGYPEENFDFKFEYAINEDTTFSFVSQYINQDAVSRWHSTTANTGWVHDNYATSGGSLDFRFYDQERSLTYARLDGVSDHSLLQTWNTTLSYQKSQDSTRRSDGRFGVLDVDTLGFTFQGSGVIAEGDFTWGVDYYHDDVDSEANEPRRRLVADDSSYDSLGAYGRYTWNVSDQLEVTAGARASYFKAKWGKLFNRTLGVDESGSGDWTDLSLSAQALYRINDTDSLYGGIAQGFRAPNLDDLTGSNVSNSSDEVVGSTDLDPEKTLSFELGHRRVSENLRWNFAGFYTIIDDPITRIDDNTVAPAVVRNSNGESGYLFGFEAEAAWKFAPQWEVSGNLTFQDGKQKALDEIGGTVTEDTIRRLSPIAGSLAITWTAESEKYWVTAKVTGAATQDNLGAGDFGDSQRVPTAGTEFGTPGYLIGSLYAGWQVNERLQLNAGLENFTDEDYRVHGSGVNGQGINFTFGGKLTW